MYSVVHARRYSFQDEKTGRTIKGTKLTVLGESVSATDETGRSVLNFSGSYELYETVAGRLPAQCNLDLEIKMQGGKPTPVVKAVTIVPKDGK